MNKDRLYFVDWLRVAVILSLIPYHAALTYTGLGDIYIKTPLKDIGILPFLIITAPLDNFFMTLLFFLSGVATYYALQFKSKRDYIKDRVRKVLIPFILGTIFICPMQAYFKGLNEGFSGNYLEFLPEFFSGKIVDYLGYAHLWFLLYLFIISLCCLPVFKKWRGDNISLGKITSFINSGKNIYLPIIFIIAVETIIRPFFPGKQIIIMDWANDIVYTSMFIFGFIFAANSKIQQRLSGMIKGSIILVVMCLFVFVYVYYSWTVLNSSSAYLSFLWAFTKGVYECYAIILLVGLGKRYFNKKSPVLSYLNKASFSYYIWHLLPVSVLTYLFVNYKINVYLKYLLVTLLSYGFVLVFYELFVKRIFTIGAKNSVRENISSN